MSSEFAKTLIEEASQSAEPTAEAAGRIIRLYDRIARQATVVVLIFFIAVAVTAAAGWKEATTVIAFGPATTVLVVWMKWPAIVSAAFAVKDVGGWQIDGITVPKVRIRENSRKFLSLAGVTTALSIYMIVVPVENDPKLVPLLVLAGVGFAFINLGHWHSGVFRKARVFLALLLIGLTVVFLTGGRDSAAAFFGDSEGTSTTSKEEINIASSPPSSVSAEQVEVERESVSTLPTCSGQPSELELDEGDNIVLTAEDRSCWTPWADPPPGSTMDWTPLQEIPVYVEWRDGTSTLVDLGEQIDSKGEGGMRFRSAGGPLEIRVIVRR